MSIKSDRWIRRMSEQHGMIEPSEPGQVKHAADGHRTQGPYVDAPAVLRERIPELGASVAAGPSAAVTGLAIVGPPGPTPAGLVAVAARAVRDGAVPGPLEPLYLRRPDAVEPSARKRVTV